MTLPSPRNHSILTLWQHSESAAVILMLFSIQISHLFMGELWLILSQILTSFHQSQDGFPFQ